MTTILDRWISRLGFAIVIVALSCLAVNAALLASPQIRAGMSFLRPPQGGFPVGTVPELAKELPLGTRATVVALARSTCGACRAAKEFLKPSFERLQRVNGVKIIMVSPAASDPEEAAYAVDLGLTASSVLGLTPKAAKQVRIVPTLLVLKMDGTVVFAKEGGASVVDAVNIETIVANLVAASGRP